MQTSPPTGGTGACGLLVSSAPELANSGVECGGTARPSPAASITHYPGLQPRTGLESIQASVACWWHACRHVSSPENVRRSAEAAFRALNEAYQTLMDGGCCHLGAAQSTSCRTELGGSY